MLVYHMCGVYRVHGMIDLSSSVLYSCVVFTVCASYNASVITVSLLRSSTQAYVILIVVVIVYILYIDIV